MFTLIKRLLGLDRSQKPASTRVNARARQTSATAHLFQKDSPAMRRAAVPAKAGKPAPAKPKPRTEFDPYNTGKFDRGASWEKISKSQR